MALQCDILLPEYQQTIKDAYVRVYGGEDRNGIGIALVVGIYFNESQCDHGSGKSIGSYLIFEIPQKIDGEWNIDYINYYDRAIDVDMVALGYLYLKTLSMFADAIDK